MSGKSTSGPLGLSVHARVGCYNTSGGPHDPDVSGRFESPLWKYLKEDDPTICGRFECSFWRCAKKELISVNKRLR